jgi:hypothetical protein
MKPLPANSKMFKKRKISTHRKIYSKKDLQKLKPPKVHQQREKKTINYTVPTDCDVHMHLEVGRRVVDYIYQNNICSKSVYSIPEKVRAGLQESTIAALLWQFGRKNRWKKQPDAHILVFGKYIIPDFSRRRIEISRESISIPMPDKLTEESKVSWIKIGEKESVITVRIAPPANAPFNISRIPMVGMSSNDDDESKGGDE